MSLAAPDALALLLKAHSHNRLAHAYLITGARGSGKLQLARDLCAHLLGCSPEAALAHPDVHSVAPESKSRRLLIDQIRELEHSIQMRSQKGGVKFAILIDCERMQPQAANALLKTLEEPPPKTHLLLLSEQPEQLLETILSRCVHVSLRAVQPASEPPFVTAISALLRTFWTSHKPNTAGGLWLAQQIQTQLAACKDQIRDRMESEFKLEEKQYKQTVDPKWLERLEETYAARTEAEYLGERTRMLEALESFWTDVLLLQNGHPARHLPSCAENAEGLAKALRPEEALARVQAVSRMRDHLGMSGVHEGLALEHGVLLGFAP